MPLYEVKLANGRTATIHFEEGEGGSPARAMASAEEISGVRAVSAKEVTARMMRPPKKVDPFGFTDEENRRLSKGIFG